MPDRPYLHPGEFVLTEHKGRFYGVGVVLLDGRQITQARCCENGHDHPGPVDECWLNTHLRGFNPSPEVKNIDGDVRPDPGPDR